MPGTLTGMRVRPARTRMRVREPPLCALILVECLVTEDAPNGLICMG